MPEDEPQPWATCTRNLVKIACGSGDILENRQTDRQTYSKYVATAPAGDITSNTKTIYNMSSRYNAYAAL